MATASEIQSGSGVVLDGVSWDAYEAQIRIIGDRPIRVNYDRGRMEITSPLRPQGNGSYLLGWMIDILVEELDMQVDPATYRRADLAQGVEPDKSYHFGVNAERVRGKRDLDLSIDPPPYLVIEVDITSSSVPRLPIFAALGIPEVWRLDGNDLRFIHLQADGSYQPRTDSRAFPNLPRDEAARFLEHGQQSNRAAWIRSFRAYVRDVLAR